MLRQSEVAEVFNHSKLCTASCLVYTDEGARRKYVRERWVGGAKGKEGREDDWEGKRYPYRSGSELEYPIFNYIAGLSRRICCSSSRLSMMY